MKVLVKKLFRAVGYDIIPKRWAEVPEYKNKGFDEGFLPLFDRCQHFTMTSAEKMFALYRAVRYLDANAVDGAIVECGVAAGGSMMMAALISIAGGNMDREIWLYDTFAGMPEPTDRDVNYRGDVARTQWVASRAGDHNEWCYASLESVRTNMVLTGYPTGKLRFIEGRVEETIPGKAPERIALLRLDTDWYASTKHELQHLYPRLCEGGVLIIDDYGHWEGCRQATDEFFGSLKGQIPLLHRIDRLGVIGVKPSSRPESQNG